MSPLELLRSGSPTEALAALKNAIRSEPANAKHRIFFFQLLCVQGEWTKALTQLNVAAELDAATLAMAQTYREAIRCEALRSEVFAGARTPIIFGEPPAWLGLLLEALRLVAEGKAAQSQQLRSQAFDAADSIGGLIDGQPVEWIADADLRLGPIIEAIVNGKYYWIPLQNIQRIDLDPPEDLRDVVWMPAHFMWANGGETVGLIPTRYPGSESSDDAAIRMARKTTWTDLGEELFIGHGQKVLATPEVEFPLMNVRQILIGSPSELLSQLSVEQGTE